MADRNGYIGRAPGDSSVVVARQTFSPTGIQTDFTFASGYVVGYLDLYLNGARLIEGQDFTATDGSVVGLTTYAQNGDVLELVAYKAFNATNVQSAGGDFSVGANLSVTGTLTVGGVEVQPGAAGTWASYDSNTGISTTKKVKIENNLEVTGAASTFSGNLTVAGQLTYEDVTNVDSIGIITARSYVSIADSIVHTGDTDTSIRFPEADTFTVETAGSERLRITSAGITTVVSGSFAIPSVPEANTDNAELPVLFQTLAGTIDGGSGLSYNPAGDNFNINGLILSSQIVRTSGSNTLTLTTADGNGQSDVRVQPATVQILGGGSEKLAVTVGGVNITGICTATSFSGDGSNLTGVGGELDVTSSLFI